MLLSISSTRLPPSSFICKFFSCETLTNGALLICGSLLLLNLLLGSELNQPLGFSFSGGNKGAITRPLSY